MAQDSKNPAFSFAPLLMLFLPHAGIAYFCQKHEVWQAGLVAAAVVTGLCMLMFLIRNWAELLAGFFGALLIIGILTLCTMIPVVGWIADVLILLFAFGSVIASIGALMPYALKAVAIWAVFLVSLLPAVFHPVASPVAVLLMSLVMGAALAKKESPFDDFLLLMSSIPLLAMAIASLGKLLQSGVTMRSARFKQNVSGYTTRAGVQVADYTRTITKAVPVGTASVNPAAAAIGSTAGQKAKDD